MTFAWPSTAPPQPLRTGEIHLWAWALTTRLCEGGCPESFDNDERARFASFRFEADRSRFASAHVTLRRLLGAYSGLKPEDLRFSRNAFGKPRLDPIEFRRETLEGTGGWRGLCFNLTHTRSSALLAIARENELGVDLEEVRPIEPEVAENHFSSSELGRLRTLKGDEWQRAFYRCWTQKEAILKAEGVGLNLDLASFDVAVLPGEQAALLDARTALRRRWRLVGLSPATGTIGALACEDPRAEIRCFSFRENRSRRNEGGV